jgi:hypothetical protein
MHCVLRSTCRLFNRGKVLHGHEQLLPTFSSLPDGTKIYLYKDSKINEYGVGGMIMESTLADRIECL